MEKESCCAEAAQKEHVISVVCHHNQGSFGIITPQARALHLEVKVSYSLVNGSFGAIVPNGDNEGRQWLRLTRCLRTLCAKGSGQSNQW